MFEISLRFTSENTDSPIQVALSRSDNGTWLPPAPFTPPLDDKLLKDLRWYLETYAEWPIGPDIMRAEGIEKNLEDWGRSLRDSVLAGPAQRSWQQFVDSPSDGKLVTVDATDPRVLRLPWELLADDGGHIFSQGIGVRRRLASTTTSPIKPFDLPVRVLVVVSRPEGAGFIDPRAVSLPLLDALDELGQSAVVEFLYPPTLKALTDRLRDSSRPPVHVVHFDGHGVYDLAQGLGYLLFEDDQHAPDRVDANRIGTLLNRCGVPLMVLNACQSAAQQETNPYASVATRLIRSGVGSVLAMNYSVLVVAARKFVGAFYGALASGLPIGKAVDEARVALLADDKRHTYMRHDADGKQVEVTLHLRDWFLPALYQQSADPVVFTGTSATPQVPRQIPRSLTDPRSPGGLPAQPLHSFHGRPREMLQLERAFAERAVVVLHGFGGMGKTALAAEAGRWFRRTGRFPGGAAFASFEGGGSLSQMCSWVGQAISDDPNFAIGDGDPVQRITELLAHHPALIILDNFESVIGREPLMPPDELKAVLDAVWRWAHAGSGRVLITTRDTTFNDRRFAPSKDCAHIELGGLSPADALELARDILDALGIDRARVDREGLVELIDRLGAHPLSLYLVVPQLRTLTPAELSAQFEQLLPGFTVGVAKERNESLAVSLEFSLRRLGEATRAALPALAVFQGGALESDLLTITEIDPELWKIARAELEAAALLTVEPLENVSVPYLHFHPTLAAYLAKYLSPERLASLQWRYLQDYYGMAEFLFTTDTQHPLEARAIAARDLPNLRHALDLAMAANLEGIADQMKDIVADFAVKTVRFLDIFGRRPERDDILQKVNQWQVRHTAPNTGSNLTKAEFMVLDQRGEALVQKGQTKQAEQVFHQLLQRIEAGSDYDSRYHHAVTLAQIGRCMQEQGQSAQAVEWLRRALTEFEPLSVEDKDAKAEVGFVNAELGRNLVEIGLFDDAQRAYESGMVIFNELGDQRSVCVNLVQLGTLALMRGDLEEARQLYNQALSIFQVLGEPHSVAGIWHQLGVVAQEEQDNAEAERCYRESLKLSEQVNDLPALARTCNQLAALAESAGRLDDAERWYQREVEIGKQIGNESVLRQSYYNLANLYVLQNRLADAATYAQRAIETKATFDPSEWSWGNYQILARIAQAQNKPGEVAHWRRKGQDSFAAYAGAAQKLPKWAPAFIKTVVFVSQGNHDAGEDVENTLQQMDAKGWRNLAAAVRRVLAGEHDFEALRGELEYREAYIVRAILAQLAVQTAGVSPGESKSAATKTPEEAPTAVTLDQFIELVGRACRPDAPAGLGEQLYNATLGMIKQPNATEEIKTLGRVLNAILCGERQLDLSQLPAELAAKVQALLETLSKA